MRNDANLRIVAARGFGILFSARAQSKSHLHRGACVRKSSLVNIARRFIARKYKLEACARPEVNNQKANAMTKVSATTKTNAMTNTVDPKTCKVALLAGGTSGERDISFASAKGAGAALAEAGFSYTLLDPANRDDIKTLVEENFDVAFLCVHGKSGEDGTLQGLLEVLHIPYIGSGVWASALATDKAKAKIFYERAGIDTPESEVLTAEALAAGALAGAPTGAPVAGAPAGAPVGAPVAEALAANGFDAAGTLARMGGTCVVKPLAEGSSIGVYIVDTAQDLQTSVENELQKNDEVLLERFVSGREFTVAVLGNEKPYALPVIEIVPQAEFYDFTSKYAEGGSRHICPAEISAAETAKVQELAVRAHCALGCAGVSRSDFILDEQGRFWILETNTIPGMTKTSLLPDAASKAGMSFAELCTTLIELALERTARA